MARVLVVEDDPWIAWMIADDLAERGYQVTTARDGADALKRLAAARPDAIVLDLMMPGINGWEFVERYQQRTGGRAIPIVIVSAARAVSRSLEHKGVRQFLPKPFDLEQLARSVAEAVASSAAPPPTAAQHAPGAQEPSAVVHP
jgi:two-component system response regulator MprA